jgi:3-deoxy-D-manno-octulosonate 8-phosphate phosphatase (KDO 8-P phosphatase)
MVTAGPKLRAVPSDLALQGITVAEAARRASRLRLVLTDNDGVLTDAAVFYSERGEELKRYSLRDGMGVELLRSAGIEVAVITREQGGAVIGRARKLGIRCFLGIGDKLAHAEQLLRDDGLTREQVAYIGDDVNDLALLRHLSETSLTAAPADAISEVLGAVHLRCQAPGGNGAFREFAEFILRSSESSPQQRREWP